VVGAEPLDLARKIEKPKTSRAEIDPGPGPLPPGWDFDPQESVEIGKLAVKTGIWPLKEYIDGQVTHTKIPHPRLPVEEYLKKQGRFAHLFHPERNDALIGKSRPTSITTGPGSDQDFFTRS
jgi:pyruvate ferredoxin oxidoreductase beta subunit